MPKPQYDQHYRKEWEKEAIFKDWLQPDLKDKNKAKCMYCKISLKAKVWDLKQHVKTKKHKSSAQPFSESRQQKIEFPKISDCIETRGAEASLCLFIAEHCSILSIDHLGELCKSKFKNSKGVSNFHLHRTKCTEIIKNVIGVHFKEDLINDISSEPYSLIIDESTDIATTKQLGIVVKYYSVSQKEVVTTYLDLVNLEDGTADSIVKALNKLLTELKLNKKQLISLGTDNASVMTGINNGVFQKLKEEWELPNLILIRCVCHSMQLAVSSAYEETLPRNIDFLVKEIYSWFNCSTLRQQEYSSIYKTINDGQTPLKIPKAAKTRWISIEPAIRRILEQWTELKLHFNLMRRNCYSAELIYNMLSDNSNLCYMVYLKCILREVQKVIKAFESESADPTKLLDSLILLYQFLANKIINPTARVDIFKDNLKSYLNPDPYLGYEFNKLLAHVENVEVKKLIKTRCINFTFKLLMEIRCRLPENLSVLRKINILSVDNCLRPMKQSIVELAEYIGAKDSDLDKIINQWNNLHTIEWINNEDTYKFWIEVRMYQDASGDCVFKELVDLAFKFLVLPNANAEVERLFSQMAIVKNKLRNRMLNPTLKSILSIRAGLRRLKKNCATYEVPVDVIHKIGKKEMYSFKSIKTDENNEESDNSDIFIDMSDDDENH